MMRGLIHSKDDSDGEQWAPVSDLMAALMLIFMFIAIMYIDTVVSVEGESRDDCAEIRNRLDGFLDKVRAKFGGWDIDLLADLTIRFRHEEFLFEAEKSEVHPKFKEILNGFFPGYMSVIDSYRGDDGGDVDIKEIRIEGHTSSEWYFNGDPLPADKAYIHNMELSQDRARAVLELGLPEVSKYSWAKSAITANGLSSSHLLNGNGKIISICDGEENKEFSRRVEFRLMTSSCQKAGIDHRESKEFCK